MLRKAVFAVVCLAACGGDDGGDGGDFPKPGELAAFPLTSVQGGIAYTVKVTIGGGQTFDLDIDTGSTTLGVAATSCTSCPTQLLPKYAPGSSAKDQMKTSQTTYGDGSGWTAENFMDSVRLDGAGEDIAMRFGAIGTDNNFFRAPLFDQGIVGFASELIALGGTDSFVAKRIAAGDNGQFAFQFCPDAGTLWMNGFDPAAATESPQFSPMVPVSRSQPFYEVDITSAKIGDVATTLSGEAVVDTGTSLLVVSSAAQASLLDAINNSAGWKSMFPGTTLDENACFTGVTKTHAELDAALPPLTFTFPGTPSFTFTLPATQSYMIDVPDSGLCYGVAAADGLPTIMGDVVMRNFVTVFDVTAMQIGFAPTKGCDFGKPMQKRGVTQTGKPPAWRIRPDVRAHLVNAALRGD